MSPSPSASPAGAWDLAAMRQHLSGTVTGQVVVRFTPGLFQPDLDTNKAANDTAPIVIRRTVSGNGAGLPVAGPPTGLVATAGARLVVLGAALVLLTRSRRAVR